jgi:GNAT superfamily N-acetyltransferase
VAIREATDGDRDLLARICAAGFENDPVMSWVFPDSTTRFGQLLVAFSGLVDDFLAKAHSAVHVVDDACATFWRSPAWVKPEPGGDDGTGPWTPEVAERFRILDEGMSAAHPHDAHWYLNVISTLPDHQGRGLGAEILAPTIATCDAEGMPAYLESSNPRNMTLYRRHGFEQIGEIELPDGPSLYPMWRERRAPA